MVLVEARDHVGGRVEGGTLEGQPIELGGTWISQGHTRLHALVEELGLSAFRTWNDEGKLLLQLGKRRTLVSQPAHPDRPGLLPHLDRSGLRRRHQ